MCCRPWTQTLEYTGACRNFSGISFGGGTAVEMLIHQATCLTLAVGAPAAACQPFCSILVLIHRSRPYSHDVVTSTGWLLRYL